MPRSVWFTEPFARSFVLLVSNDESETMDFGLELGTEKRTQSAFFLARSFLYPVFAGSNSSRDKEVYLGSAVLCGPA
jgi:hypothetical protein